jgi:multidrug resistance efflux pump
VASVDPKVGEAYSAAVPAIDLVSAGNYKINLMIPENQVADIEVGDSATLSFNASSDLTATATVSSIDLAPTVNKRRQRLQDHVILEWLGQPHPRRHDGQRHDHGTNS